MSEDASNELDDDSIVLRMMDGDQNALRLMYETHVRKVRAALSKRYRGVLAEPEIDAAINRGAMKVYRNADRFDGSKGTLRGWFYRNSIWAAQDIIRREERHLHQVLEFDPAYNPEADHGEGPSPDDQAESRQVRDLQKAIKTELTPSERKVIEADKAAGDDGVADSARLAETMGSTVASIHALRSKARKKIQQYMINQGHFQNKPRGKR